MIILLTNKFDISVDFVVRLLRKRGAEFLRMNTEDLFDQNVKVTFPEFSMTIEDREKSSELVQDLRSVLFRRPGKPFEFLTRRLRPANAVVTYVENQWHAFLEGICTIQNVLWVNDPLKNHRAENKILQLEQAAVIGFNVPRTCITSSKEKALEFAKTCLGNVVAKSLYAPLIEYPKRDFFIFTTKMGSLERLPDSEFKLAPTIFQEAIEDKVDYRVTVVGNDCYPVKIESTDNMAIPIDWRLAQKRLRYAPFDIPDDLENKCVKLVKDLGLIFGAIDLVERDGKFYFLEVNPSGEWGWLEKEAKLPIAETLVNILSKGNEGAS